jgi:hypothetical protein
MPSAAKFLVFRSGTYYRGSPVNVIARAEDQKVIDNILSHPVGKSQHATTFGC